uniref:Uncharacterized protein n=1 Tax=Tetranychus urticae TaxID=32264 RepID=A0A158P4K3_TETUR
MMKFNKNLFRLIKSRLTSLIICKSIFSLFCLLGCLFQLVHLTRIYLKFEVITEIVISLPQRLVLPDICMCIEIVQFVNLTKLNELYPALAQQMIKYDRSENNATVTDIYGVNASVINHYVLYNLRINETYNLLYPDSHLINSWEIGSRSIVNQSVLESQGCRMRGRFKDFGYCITIGCPQSNHQAFGEFDYLRSQIGRPMFAIYLNRQAINHIPNMYVALIKNTALPRGNTIKFETLKLNASRKYPISYHIFRSNLLPPPYSTQCEDYASDRFDTMEHARELCLTNATLKRYNIPFPKVLASPDWGYYNGYRLMFDAITNQTLQTELDSIVLGCINITYQPHCHDTYYITTTTDSEYISSSNSQVELRKPVEPYITTTCQPKQSLPEFFIYAGSVLGTWFGFNFAYSIPSLIDLCYHKIYKKIAPQRSGSSSRSHSGSPFYLDPGYNLDSSKRFDGHKKWAKSINPNSKGYYGSPGSTKIRLRHQPGKESFSHGNAKQQIDLWPGFYDCYLLRKYRPKSLGC